MSERWIIVSNGVPQRELVGRTKLTDKQIWTIVDKGELIELTQAWYLQSMHIPTPQGIAQNIQCVPVGLNRGAITLYTRVVYFYDPHQDEDSYNELMKQIHNATDSEAQLRAKDAGIAAPGTMRVGPSGRLIS